MKVVEQMLSRYARAEGHHALREVMQEIALAGLQRAGFFDGFHAPSWGPLLTFQRSHAEEIGG